MREGKEDREGTMGDTSRGGTKGGLNPGTPRNTPQYQHQASPTHHSSTSQGSYRDRSRNFPRAHRSQHSNRSPNTISNHKYRLHYPHSHYKPHSHNIKG